MNYIKCYIKTTRFSLKLINCKTLSYRSMCLYVLYILSLCLTKHYAMKTYGKMEVHIHLFLSMALGGENGQYHSPAALPLGKERRKKQAAKVTATGARTSGVV
jgi:hypothetical protein